MQFYTENIFYIIILKFNSNIINLKFDLKFTFLTSINLSIIPVKLITHFSLYRTKQCYSL